MSRTIDERVVSMQFDNKHFESNVRTSLSTLDKLKQSLNLTGAAKGLDHVNAAAKSCNLSPLGSAVEGVKLKFSALEVMAVTALSNITNSAVNAGKRIVNSLTLEPVMTGFKEYETQIGAIQTILANTQSKGSTLEDVNGALDELNTYADKTIYNFTEMTKNIGTFTAAGVDLDKSVQSIKGIANLAAISGSTSNQASTAMYQLSQALAAGKVQLMDWNSVVNAGMGGEVFQTALKRTATQMGYNVDAMIKKYGSFRESLTQGEWLTAEVLTETLAQLSGAYTKADLIAQGYTEKQAQEITELAKTAESAATDVKTFTQLMDTLKESAQSGWTQTWELIVGDFEESKALWSGVSETIGGLINTMSERRNKLLGGALTSNWDKMISKIEEAGFEASDFEEKAKAALKKHGYDVDELVKKHGSLEKAFQSGAASSDILKEAVDELGGSIEGLSKIEKDLKMGDKGEDVKKVQQALKQLNYELGEFGEGGIDGIIGDVTESAIKEFQKDHKLEVTGVVDDKTLAALEEATKKSNELGDSLDSLIDGVDELGGRQLLIESFKNAWTALTKPLKAIGKAWRDTFDPVSSEQLYKVIEGVHSLSEKMIMSTETTVKLWKTFKGLFAVLEIVSSIFNGGLKLAFRAIGNLMGLVDLDILSVTAHIGDVLVKFRDWVFENNILIKAFDKAVVGVKKFAIAVKDWIKAFYKTPEVQEKIQRIKDAFSSGFEGAKDFFSGGLDKIKEFIKGIGSMDSFSFENIVSALSNFKNKVIDYFVNFDASKIWTGIKSGFTIVKDKLGDILDKIIEKFGVTKEKFEEFKNKISEFFGGIKDTISEHSGAIFALGTLIGIILLLKKIKDMLSLISKPFEALSDIGGSISGFFDSLKDLNKAKAKSIKYDNVLTIAKAITLLAGSLWIVSKIKNEDLLKAGVTLGILTAIVVGMVFLVSKLNKDGNILSGINFAGLGAAMTSFGLAMLAMTASVKILGGMKPAEVTQGINVVITLGLLIGSIILITDKIGDDKSIANFGKMMKNLGTSLLLMTAAIYILGKMDGSTLVQGGLAVLGFFGIVTGMMAATKLIGPRDTEKFGKLIRSLSTSLILLSFAVLIFGKMDTKTLVQGGIAVTVFMGIISSMMMLTANRGVTADKFGKMMSGVGTALLMMSIAIKILGSMDVKDLIKGTVVIGALSGIIIGLMAATKLLGKNTASAGKVGLMMLGFAGSILLITASISALALLEGKKIAKALIAIGGISAIFAGLIYVTKYAGDVGIGTLIGLSAAIAIMAGSIIALSFINPKKLATASLALVAVAGSLTSIAYVAKDIKMKNLVPILALTLLVGGLGILINALIKNTEDADKALKLSTGLAALILSMSASALLLSKIGKNSKAAFVGVGVLAAIMGVVGLFVGIAIASLPKVGKKLSEFMENLAPFLEGVKGVDGKLFDNIKTLGEAMSAFAGAGAKFAIGEFFTGGGVTKSFTQFAEFIKEIVPIVKDMAVDVSDVDINYGNLDAIVGAVKGLAEAAGSLPTTMGGGVATLWGGGGFFSIPDLESFISFIKEVIPVVKDMALELSGSGVKINTTALNSVIDVISALAEAADNAPGIDIGVAFGGLGKKGWGAGAYASIPQLKNFIEFVNGVSNAMVDLAIDVSEANISETDIKAITSICEAVSVLATAADNAPGIDAGIAGAFSKFAGGWAVGVGGGVSVPGLDEFISFVEAIVPSMSGLTLNVKEAGITEKDAGPITSICEAVSVLATAAKDAPSTTVAAGLAKFAIGAGGGVYVDVPALENFITFIKDVTPVLSDLTLDVKAAKIDESDGEALQSICKASEILGVAAKNSPGIKIAAGAFSAGPVIGGGAYLSVPQLSAFKDWITEVIPVLSGFTIDVKEAKIKEEDGIALQSICQAAKLLAEAAKDAPKEDVFASVFGVYVSSTDLEGFTEWIATVVPMLSGIASGQFTDADGNTVTLENIDSTKLSVLTSICNAAKTIAEAAALAPKEEVYSNIFGTWVSSTDIQDTVDWIMAVTESIRELTTSLVENPIDTTALSTVQSVANAAKTLSEAVYNILVAQNQYGYFDAVESDTLKSHFEGIAIALNGFSTEVNKIKDINVEKISNIASAAKNAVDAFTSISNFNYDTVDVVSLSAKLEEIATAISDFATDMSDVDSSAASEQVRKLSSLVGGLTYISFAGASSFKTALEDLSKTGVDEFVGAFEDAADDAVEAAETMVGDTASAIKSETMYNKFVGAGKYLVGGFAKGITDNTFKAEAKAKAMAQAAYDAAKKALDINSPSRKFIPLGNGVVEGFVKGVDQLRGDVKRSSVDMANTAIDGTKNAIARVADAINSDIDTQPTIRPVLDLSDVSAGAGAINGMFNMHPSVGAMANLRAINTMMANGQNGTNDDVISAIKELGNKIGNASGDTYSINGITYDDGSNIADTVKTLVRAARMERRT